MPGLEVWKKQRINRLRRDMDRLFDKVWGEFGLSVYPRAIRGPHFIDMTETDNNLILRLKIPGIDPETLDISITNNNLSIKGEIQQEFVENGQTYRRVERSYGSFSRAIQLPYRVLVDNVKATYDKGILKIIMPKSKPEKSKKIQIACK